MRGSQALFQELFSRVGLPPPALLLLLPLFLLLLLLLLSLLLFFARTVVAAVLPLPVLRGWHIDQYNYLLRSFAWECQMMFGAPGHELAKLL